MGANTRVPRDFIAAMKRVPPPYPQSCRRLGPLLALAGALFARAQTVPLDLAPMVVTATRQAESSAQAGSDVQVISGSDLERRQLWSLADALSGVPAAPLFATGQAGAEASLFLRGANSNQTLFMVDGIRISDANTDAGNFLGGARIFPGDTVEIAQGPQSTLYGGEAVGGVVSVRTAEGAGPASGQVESEAGSFGTIDGLATAQAGEGAWAYNVSAAGEHTDNDRPNNSFDSANLALRLDDRLSPAVAVGATVRGLTERYGDPGDEYTSNPYDFEREDNWLATTFADLTLSENVSSHLTVGGQDRRFVAVAPEPGQPADIEVAREERGVVDWQVTGRATAGNVLVGGLTAETDADYDNGFGEIDSHQGLLGLYAEDQWTPLPDLFVTGGLRRDDYSTFGAADTGRGTVAWLVAGGALKLRASYGTGFDAPSFLDLYGRADGYLGNPSLQPERTRGEDAGFDCYLVPNGLVVSATWFRDDFTNLIEDNFDVFPATTENVQRARTDGAEVAVKLIGPSGLRVRLDYTYLQAANLSDPGPLLRRPRDSASGDVGRDFGSGFSAGAGAVYVGRRADVDALTFATVEDPGYSVARVYAAYRLGARWSLKGRVENALDRRYEPVNGYPQPGIACYGGAEFSF